MKTKTIKIPSIIKIYYLIFSLFFVYTNILAQSYFYYPKLEKNSSRNDIYRLNNATGEDELFIKDVGHVSTMFQFDNADGTNLYLDQRGVLTLIRVNNPNKRITISESDGVIDIKEAHKINRVIVEYSKVAPTEYRNTVIYNIDTCEPIDTIHFYSSDSLLIDDDNGTFFSKDEKKLYVNTNKMDTTGIYFSAFDILNNTLLYKNRKINNFSRPDHLYFDEVDEWQGKALFLGHTPGYKEQKFFIVNPDSGLYFAPVSIPPIRSEGHLSVNADYVIIEQVKMILSDKYPNTIDHTFYPGKVQIYSAITGDKITDLTIPSSDDFGISFHDNSPNMIYYYNDENNTENSVDLTKLQIENNLSGSVKVTITNPDSIKTFGYTVTNSDTSKQAIKNIYVENTASIQSTNLPDGWTNIAGTDKYNLIGFKSQSEGILSGAAQSGYAVSTTGLPAIGNVYLQSGRSTVDTADIFGNSYVVETIVPTSKPEVFNANEFVDTLIYYNNKSLSNNWLTAEWVKNVFESSLNNAKLFISQKQYTSAVPVMQQLITILDSYKTSGFVKDEAYYLLKNNSQYLIEKLNILAVTPPPAAVAQLDSVFAANELNRTNSWYSAEWVYTVLTSILNNAKITLNQNNLVGTKLIIEQFVTTLDSYKTSGFITEEGYNNIKPKCLTLIEMLE